MSKGPVALCPRAIHCGSHNSEDGSLQGCGDQDFLARPLKSLGSGAFLSSPMRFHTCWKTAPAKMPPRTLVASESGLYIAFDTALIARILRGSIRTACAADRLSLPSRRGVETLHRQGTKTTVARCVPRVCHFLSRVGSS